MKQMLSPKWQGTEPSSVNNIASWT